MLHPEGYRRKRSKRKEMKRTMKKNNKGFTLAELLIVVAIIAILVAVSIPMFASQLGKARLATNEANVRAAKAAAVATYLSDVNHDADGESYSYNLKTGTAEHLDSTPSGYVEITGDVDGTKEIEKIYVTVSEDGGSKVFVQYKS